MILPSISVLSAWNLPSSQSSAPRSTTTRDSCASLVNSRLTSTSRAPAMRIATDTDGVLCSRSTFER
ncbi:Uncharacterised protein [Mycobacteroides abscessus subsp. abscessus]|nr:Uncharacterised protein [Mycobacteroides abscessus subsp. abscessus]